MRQPAATPVAIATRSARHLAFDKLFETSFGAGDVQRYRSQLVPADGMHLAVTQSDRATGTARSVTGWIAIGSLAAGAAMSAWAIERSHSAAGSSQRRRAELNDTISTANRASIGFYAVGAAAAVAWLLLAPEDRHDSGYISVSPVAQTNAGVAVTYSKPW